jgi:hypothetical protein
MAVASVVNGGVAAGNQAEPVKPRTQITSAERTNMWTVCLTSQGVLGYLNRRVSPLGERLLLPI